MSDRSEPKAPACMPEADLASLAPFEISAPLAVRKLLAELARKHALIWLFVANEEQSAMSARLLAASEAGLEFALHEQSPAADALRQASQCTVVGFLDNVKVQFEMTTQPSVASDDATLLRGALPARLYRIQRRAAFRVRTPAGHPGSVVIRSTPGKEQSFALFDLSATGLSFLRAGDAADTPVFSVDDRIPLARLELGPRVPVPCTLVVRSLLCQSETPPLERVGCEFVNLPAEVERSIAVYVQEAEREILRSRRD